MFMCTCMCVPGSLHAVAAVVGGVDGRDVHGDLGRDCCQRCGSLLCRSRGVVDAQVVHDTAEGLVLQSAQHGEVVRVAELIQFHFREGRNVPRCQVVEHGAYLHAAVGCGPVARTVHLALTVPTAGELSREEIADGRHEAPAGLGVPQSVP